MRTGSCTAGVVSKARNPLSEFPISMNFAPKKQYKQHNISSYETVKLDLSIKDIQA